MTIETFLNDRVTLHPGDCLDVLARLGEGSIDSCVTDPPYHLTSIVKRFGSANAAPVIAGKTGAYKRASAGFMGKQWDGGDIAFTVDLWAQVYRVLKPGAHLIAFSGTRTYHRMVCAIEDAGFEVRDQIGWCYGSGFPKSHDVSKGIDKTLGAERSRVRIDASEVRNPKATGAGRDGMEGATRPWIEEALKRGFHEAVSDEAVSDEAVGFQGWGTALKPAWEPCVLARKPLIGTVAANVLAHGTGALNIDDCRVGSDTRSRSRSRSSGVKISENLSMAGGNYSREYAGTVEGRWPANIIHDGSPEVMEAFPDNLSSGTGAIKKATGAGTQANAYGKESRPVGTPNIEYGDTGSAARFFYTAKADSDDRIGSKHPTVKPVDLMQYLVRLVTPKGGVVLDPFSGTGTTGEAAFREGMRAVLIEREEEYQADIRRRMALCMSGPEERSRESIKAKHKDKPVDHGPLFGGAEVSV